MSDPLPASRNLAAVLYSPGDGRIQERDVPTPGPREVFEIRAVGVCGSDVPLVSLSADPPC